jgi:formate-nitrite transporter family protein
MRHRDKANEPKELRPQAELELSDREEREIIERLRPNAIVIHEAIRIEGESELRRPASALAWSGLAAGLSMGFSLVGRGLLIANLPDQPWRHILASFGYTIGFVIVVMGRQQLFTENTVTAILPLLSRRSRSAFMKVLRLWIIV